MNHLTIQINNLEALERLIGGDSQVEIDIRNSVASRYLYIVETILSKKR